MIALISKRFVLAATVLLLVTFMVVGMQDLTPGDPAATVAGDSASPQVIAQIREQLGLNDPLPLRYVYYVRDVVRLDFGASLQTGQQVSDLVGSALPATVSIAVLAMIMTAILAAAAGVPSALRHRGWVDRAVVFGTALGLAAPPFVLALILQTYVSLHWALLPATGYVPLGDGPGLWLKSAFLPAFVLALASAAEMTRQVRGALIDTLEQDFIMATRSKGISEAAVVFRHAFRNSATPALTVLGLQVSRIIGGAVIIEGVFALPGLGQLGFNAIVNHDYPVVQAVVLVGAILVVGSNLVVDVVNGWIDPRARA